MILLEKINDKLRIKLKNLKNNNMQNYSTDVILLKETLINLYLYSEDKGRQNIKN